MNEPKVEVGIRYMDALASMMYRYVAMYWWVRRRNKAAATRIARRLALTVGHMVACRDLLDEQVGWRAARAPAAQTNPADAVESHDRAMRDLRRLGIRLSVLAPDRFAKLHTRYCSLCGYLGATK